MIFLFALFADTPIVKVRFGNQEIGCDSRRHRGDRHIIYGPATVTPKVSMRSRLGIIVSLLVINRQLLCSPLLHQQSQCVVNRHTRQGGYRFTQLGIYAISCGMRTMLHKVVHDGYPLHRWLYAMRQQVIVSILSNHYNQYIFLIGTKLDIE